MARVGLGSGKYKNADNTSSNNKNAFMMYTHVFVCVILPCYDTVIDLICMYPCLYIYI